jgi:hypothetical protein
MKLFARFDRVFLAASETTSFGVRRLKRTEP